MQNPIFLALLSSLTLCSFADANAQNANTETESDIYDDIERIVVTADLFQRDLSELPSTALVLGQQAIASKQARHLQDLLGVMPNLNFASGASRGRFVQIRGVGERSQFAEPINPSIGLLLDNIDVSGIGALTTINDLAQLEVLSGPQSVASGVNSIGGVVKLVTNDASEDQYARLALSLAEFNESQIAGTYNNSISERVNARVSFQQTKSNGFIENQFLARSDTSKIDELTLSGKINVQLANNKTLKASIFKFDIDNGYDEFSLDNNRITQSDQPGNDSVNATALSTSFQQQFNAHELQINLFHLNAKTEYGYDEDWTFDGFHPFGYTSFDVYFRDIIRTGVDVKLASENTKGNAYLLGASLVNTDEDLLRQNTFLSQDYLSVYRPRSASIYGQYNYLLSDKLTLSTAARLERFNVNFSDNFGNTEIDDKLFSASLSADYRIGTGIVFASVTRGYKAAGFNIDERLPTDNRSYDAEYNYSYELGVKGTAFDNLANINVTMFYMQRENAQIDDSLVIAIDDTGASSFIDGIGNADAGINKGLEIMTTWDISQDFYVQANFGYLDATIGDYTRLDGEYVPIQEQAHAPRFTGFISSNWQITNNVNWYIDVEHKSDFRLGVNHNARSNTTYVVNSELVYQSYSQHQYQVKLWVKNLLDEEVINRGFGSFPNDPRDGYESFGPYYQLGQPRQFGVTFEYEWY